MDVRIKERKKFLLNELKKIAKSLHSKQMKKLKVLQRQKYGSAKNNYGYLSLCT